MSKETVILKPDKKALDLAAQLLKDGEIVGMPTETVYGLAASAFCDEAVKKIFLAKGRPQDNPLIVHISNMDMLDGLVTVVSDDVKKLAAAFWPGPLTMVMPRTDKIAPSVSAGLDTVAIRMPSHKVARKLIDRCNLPIAAPSANLSGSPSPTTAMHVFKDMNTKIPLILDGGGCKVGVESTVVDLSGETPVLLRPGYVTKEQMEKVLGKEVLLSNAVLNKLKDGERANSPGMKYKHYAPKAEVTIIEGKGSDYVKYVNEHKAEGVFALCFSEDEKALNVPCICYGKAKSPKSQAQGLFFALRDLDDKGAKVVFAHSPLKNGVSMAVYNRMLRAAAFKVIKI